MPIENDAKKKRIFSIVVFIICFLLSASSLLLYLHQRAEKNKSCEIEALLSNQAVYDKEIADKVFENMDIDKIIDKYGSIKSSSTVFNNRRLTDTTISIISEDAFYIRKLDNYMIGDCDVIGAKSSNGDLLRVEFLEDGNTKTEYCDTFRDVFSFIKNFKNDICSIETTENGYVITIAIQGSSKNYPVKYEIIANEDYMIESIIGYVYSDNKISCTDRNTYEYGAVIPAEFYEIKESLLCGEKYRISSVAEVSKGNIINQTDISVPVGVYLNVNFPDKYKNSKKYADIELKTIYESKDNNADNTIIYVSYKE